MNSRYFLVGILVISLFASCKSKKKVRYKPIEVSTIKKSTEDYIEEFKQEAMSEMREFKIPASITLAQGILESSSGNSQLTRNSNNHFGIKCHKGWEGGRIYHDDDEKGECFRVYKDPRKSYRDHSLFLTGRSRYEKLFKFHKGDYVKWAKGLSEAGYATDRRYPAKLIALIEKFELHKYDTEVLGGKFKTELESNENANYTVKKGDTLYSISRKYGLSVNELKKINKLRSNDISIGQNLILSK